MQNKVTFLSIFLFISLSILATEKNNSLSPSDIKLAADSLFQEKNYTDAKVLYDDLYFKRQYSSDDLLLKLALINEGLENIAWTEYFLEKYLQSHPQDEKTKLKIVSLADKHQLSGYKSSDIEEILSFILPYKTIIGLVLMIILILLFIISYFAGKIRHYTPLIVIISMITLVLTFAIDKPTERKYGIITEDSLLMDQPSAAGNLVAKINPGHKTLIIDKIDVWYKVLHNDKEVYINHKNLIEL